MQFNLPEQKMAESFYGYGYWTAPYWFIGPEPGMGPKEIGNAQLSKTWCELGEHELCDCRDFHRKIGELGWHGEHPRLQTTWRPLMLLLLSFLNERADTDSLRAYQRDRWGRQVKDAETCVIELSGLAAKGLHVPIDRERFRQDRIATIRQRIKGYMPKLVFMYGSGEQKHWEQIAGCELLQDQIVTRDSTVFVFTRHPVSPPGRTNSDWHELGRKLATVMHSSVRIREGGRTA
jgi:hypothetical protein